MKRYFWLLFFGSSSTPSDVIGLSNNGDQYPYYYSDDVALFQAILLAQNL